MKQLLWGVSLGGFIVIAFYGLVRRGVLSLPFGLRGGDLDFILLIFFTAILVFSMTKRTGRNSER